eukprot:TRINITY_DN8019_c0_g1_i1.p1 TRINITY_DN8019_c0_g1~~TRINITY_DN8019_c0_g1_i1.p1  ORF type:complete len:155 (+),score=5.22 TRINITY_DN8019_c0_g1_i1:38-466(+)
MENFRHGKLPPSRRDVLEPLRDWQIDELPEFLNGYIPLKPEIKDLILLYEHWLLSIERNEIDLYQAEQFWWDTHNYVIENGMVDNTEPTSWRPKYLRYNGQKPAEPNELFGSCSPNDIISLDVGGRHCSTFRKTLTSIPGVL